MLLNVLLPSQGCSYERSSLYLCSIRMPTGRGFFLPTPSLNLFAHFSFVVVVPPPPPPGPILSPFPPTGICNDESFFLLVPVVLSRHLHDLFLRQDWSKKKKGGKLPPSEEGSSLLSHSQVKGPSFRIQSASAIFPFLHPFVLFHADPPPLPPPPPPPPLSPLLLTHNESVATTQTPFFPLPLQKKEEENTCGSPGRSRGRMSIRADKHRRKRKWKEGEKMAMPTTHQQVHILYSVNILFASNARRRSFSPSLFHACVWVCLPPPAPSLPPSPSSIIPRHVEREARKKGWKKNFPRGDQSRILLFLLVLPLILIPPPPPPLPSLSKSRGMKIDQEFQVGDNKPCRGKGG